MADLNKQELRRLAEAATPGPWTATDYGSDCDKGPWWFIDTPAAQADIFDDGCPSQNHSEASRGERDMKFIAAANPATILALLDELERLERFKTAYMEWQDKTEWVQKTAQPEELGKHRADVLAQRLKKAEAERDAAVAELEACKRGRPLDLARFDFGGPLGAVSDGAMGASVGALLEPAKDDGEGSVNG